MPIVGVQINNYIIEKGPNQTGLQSFDIPFFERPPKNLPEAFSSQIPFYDLHTCPQNSVYMTMTQIQKHYKRNTRYKILLLQILFSNDNIMIN